MKLDFARQFLENVERLANRVAFQHIDKEGKTSFTFQQVGHEVSQLALFLQRQQIGPDQTVGILMENHPRWGIAFLAAQSTGARIAPFDILHGSQTLASLIQHAGCEFLISSQKFLPQLKEVQTHLEKPLPTLVSGEAAEGFFHWDTILQESAGEQRFPLVEGDPDRPFVILYTSGTTGNPKGVILSRRNIYSNVEALLKVIRVGDSDHVLSVLPLYHVLALMTNFIIPLYAGARVTYLDSVEAQRIMTCFREENVSIFVCVPQFFYLVHRRILHEVQKQSFLKRFLFRRFLSLSRWLRQRLGWTPAKFLFAPIHRQFGRSFRIFGVGGARFDEEVAQSFYDLGFTIIQAYGMTETAALITLTPPESQVVGTVGPPLENIEVRIDAPDSEGVGEIVVRGENIMKGYWQNPEATDEVLQQGWLHSGDLGYLDGQNHLHITGRKKDVIVLSSGKNVFPEELEHFYESNCPYIKEMCVLGISQAGAEAQEKLHAVMVPDFDYMKSQQTVNSYEMLRYLMETLSQQLPSYKRVHSFEIRREPLPRTTTRKIKRFQVAQELERDTSQPKETRFEEPSVAQTPSEAAVFKAIQEMKEVPFVHREMNLELDLGFESLERVELLSTIQQWTQTHIPDEAAARILTVEDLVEAAEGKLGQEVQESQDAHHSWSEILQQPLRAEDQQKLEDRLRSRPVVELIFYLGAKLMYLPARFLFRLRLRNGNRLPDQYPFLICPNHLSFLDAFLLSALLPYRVIRRMFFLGYSDYFNRPIISYLSGLVKVLPVDPDLHLRQALRLGAEGLRKGYVLCVFPEGERSIDGTLKPFRKGAAILAKETGVPVVPTAILGTYEAWPRGVERIRLHPVEIRFGEPLGPPGQEESYQAFNQRLFQAVKRLLAS